MDESKVQAYVRALAKKYNTAYGKRPFLTTYGDVVTIPGGSYGWRMNEPAEAEAVLQALKEGAIRTREPEWLQMGASHGEYDYGDTYVEVNLTGQHLFFYKEGKLITECDFVSGNAAKGWSTPAGIFPLTYKQRNATLRGENYATPVSYWMPFNGNIGLHDADWRASFGGNIYRTNGSHGCVNLPPAAAKVIYEHISKGDPVICYHLEGTETKETSGTKPAAKPTKPAETAPAAPETQPTVPETAPAAPETAPAAPETQPAVPETQPAVPETQPAMPETAPENGPSARPLTPEAGGALTETRPAGPGAEVTTPPQTSGVSGPGSQKPQGPGNSTGGSIGPGTVTGPGASAQGPGSQTGPGTPSETTAAASYSDFVMPETAAVPTA